MCAHDVMRERREENVMGDEWREAASESGSGTAAIWRESEGARMCETGEIHCRGLGHVRGRSRGCHRSSKKITGVVTRSFCGSGAESAGESASENPRRHPRRVVGSERGRREQEQAQLAPPAPPPRLSLLPLSQPSSLPQPPLPTSQPPLP